MSFATPLLLVLLLGVPVLIVWYLRRQRGRARDRSAFVLPALAPSVAPERPGWRRHLPMIAFATALTVLIVALAGPQATRAVPIKRATIMLARRQQRARWRRPTWRRRAWLRCSEPRSSS